MTDKSSFKEKYEDEGEPNEQFRQSVLEGISEASVEISNMGRTKRGVACLSAKRDDLLMWSHYADGHRGFCLEFDCSIAPFDKALEVQYSDEIPEVRPIEALLENKKNEIAERMITTKYTCWSYEVEWRILHSEPRSEFPYPPEALTGLYFGSEMPEVHIEILALIIGGQNPNTKLFRCSRDAQLFSLKINRVSYTRHIDRKDIKRGSAETSPFRIG